jgi:hypothetical protein
MAKMDKWMEKMVAKEKEAEPKQESFNEQGEPQINFLQTREKMRIPEEVEHPWMDYLIYEGREDIDRIATSQMINLNHIIGETAYIKEVEELLTEYDEIIRIEKGSGSSDQSDEPIRSSDGLTGSIRGYPRISDDPPSD